MDSLYLITIELHFQKMFGIDPKGSATLNGKRRGRAWSSLSGLCVSKYPTLHILLVNRRERIYF